MASLNVEDEYCMVQVLGLPVPHGAALCSVVVGAEVEGMCFSYQRAAAGSVQMLLRNN